MNAETLEQAGLNATQSKAYLSLITSGTLTPPELALKIGVTRTNAYEVLAQLEVLKLAEKNLATSKVAYRPLNPAGLEDLMEGRRKDIVDQEQRLRSLMPQLMTYFFTYSEQPGVRFFQGRNGIVEVYEDILRTRQPVCLIRSKTEESFLGKEFMERYIAQRTKLGISVESLTPDLPEANHDTTIDQAQLLMRTWFDPAAITAPVEVDIFGDKVAFISFGEEAMATIIESPQIAMLMRQAFQMMKLGAGNVPSNTLPTSQILPPDQTSNQTPLEYDSGSGADLGV